MIIFKTLSYENFLSTGNYKNTIDLTRHNNTLISGENGTGKSTMLDAITFSLFGKSFRGVNIPQLVNSINESGCVTEIEFSSGSDEYKVIRGLKPKRFEIYKNNELINQDAKSKDYQKILEEQIIKMSYKSFCQVVILGSSNYIPFMKLPAKDRRLVVENLLDIDVFSVMNILVRGRLQSIKEQITDIDHKIEIMKEKVDAKHKLIETLQKKSSDNINKHKTEIENTKIATQELQEEIKNHQTNIDALLESVKDKNNITDNLLQAESSQKEFKGKIKNIERNVKFYEENDNCPSCKQDIQEHHKESVFKEQAEEKSKTQNQLEKILDEIQITEDKLNEINKTIEDIHKIEKTVNGKQNQISASSQYVTKLLKNIESSMVEGTEIQEAKDELNQIIGEGKACISDRKEKIEDRHYYNIASTMLKDSGIKAKIIKHYLPVMNKLINKYLTDMDFFCHFELNENFEETIKSRHRDDFTYYNFSEGERLRIDLSLLLAWREVARLKNSVNCNLLILDEVFDSSLDSVGTEEFLKVLATFGNRANIFVISHKSDTMTDKFDNHIVFEKKNNFSSIK
ncbi:MAG: AAA family ATPase [Candidatus Marinimicrobia bacterium]|jgi:DNA repair exonuclease SbcCD ATPase subunit|nr:AAA family ATPase [Candidatus Neomarinimicrobiota bacterium]